MVAEELSEVPGDVATGEGAVFSKVLVKWVGIIAVHLSLLKHIELSVVFFYEFSDLVSAAWLLRSELIAWECKDLKTRCVIGLVKLYQLLVVGVGQSSEGGDVHEENGLFVVGVRTNSPHSIPIKIVSLEAKHARRLLQNLRLASQGFMLRVSAATHI